MTVKQLKSRVVREKWRQVLDMTTTGESDVVITRHGKPVTAMIRYEDYVALQDILVRLRARQRESFTTMVASEKILDREWDTPEEDAAWADL